MLPVAPRRRAGLHSRPIAHDGSQVTRTAGQHSPSAVSRGVRERSRPVCRTPNPLPAAIPGMNLVDFLLNIAVLLLWLNWRSFKIVRAPQPGGPGFSSVLKQATPPGYPRIVYLFWLLVLLAARTWFYWRIGSGVRWVPSLDLGVITLPFKSISLRLMALYSVGSFAVAFVVFYLWLVLISIVNRSSPDTDWWQRLVRLHLGWVESWPMLAKLLVPWLLAACLWYLVHPGLVALGLVVPVKSTLHLWEQGLLLGMGTFIAWKYVIGVVLLIHVVNTYLYLGNYELWQFINGTARNLLLPIRWLPLRVGQIDFAPVVAIALVFLAAQGVEHGLGYLFARLPV